MLYIFSIHVFCLSKKAVFFHGTTAGVNVNSQLNMKELLVVFTQLDLIQSGVFTLICKFNLLFSVDCRSPPSSLNFYF